MDNQAGPLQPESAPSNAGTKHLARSTGQPANLIQARVGLPVHVDELKRDQPKRITLISEYKFGVGHRYQRLVLKPEQIADLMQESEF